MNCKPMLVLALVTALATLAAAQSSANTTTKSTTPTSIELEQVQREELNLHLSHFMLYALLALAGAVLAFRATLSTVQHVRTLTCLNNATQRFFTIPNPNWARFKNQILYAPLFRFRHSREFRLSSAVNMGILPTRLQAIFLISILAANITLCVYGIPWHLPKLSVLPILRNRIGTIAVANLVPLMLFNGPTNPLITLLNISYDTFNMMHRWFGRLAVLQGFAHVLCWIIATVEAHGWSAVGKALTHPFIMRGMVTICAFVVILLQSPSAIRHAFYEVFLHLHIALALVALVFLWMHLDGFPQQNLLLAAIILWAAYRFLRLASLIRRNASRRGTKVAVDILPGDAVRLSFTSPRPWTFRPGQYMYVYIPSIGLWTSHPFTVAWSDVEVPTGHGTLTASSYDEKIFGIPLPELDPRGKQVLSAIVRRRTGFTNKLYEKAKKAGATQGTPLVLNAFIEGPYGICCSMSSYGTVMLFAGGVGITHHVPYLRELVKGYAAGTVATRKVILVWVIQSPEHLEWIRPWITQVLALEKRRDVLSIKLFVTRPRTPTEIISPSATVQMYPGRPSVETLISKECESMIGCMGVSVCGTGELQDEVRRVVRQKGMWANIDFVQESFSW